MTKRKRQHEKQGRYTDKDGYKKKKKVPKSHRPKTALVDDSVSSQPLIAQAIKQGWIGQDGQRWDTDITVKALQERSKKDGLNAKERALLAVINDMGGERAQQAVSNLIRMESQNQSDEHFVVTQATPELHVHGHRHQHTGSDDPEFAAVLAAIDDQLARRGIDATADQPLGDQASN